MIEVRKLTKRYGNFTAVNDVSFTIPAGEIFCFLGKNGAGKTTTIKMLAGLLQPTSGSISLGGHDMSKEPEAAKALTGYIPDRPYMYTKLTSSTCTRVKPEPTTYSTLMQYEYIHMYWVVLLLIIHVHRCTCTS